jgi:predicted NBD/HSP70 family sugar kinase
MRKIADQWLRNILGLLYQRRSATRGEITQSTGLNPASVSHSLRYLTHNGTILKVGELKSDGGRRREVIKLNEEAAYFVAVDLEGSRIRFAFTNFVGEIRYRWEEDIEFGTPLDVRRVVHGVQTVLGNLALSQRSRIIAIGVSCAGIISKSSHVTAFNLGWHKFPLLAEMGKRVDIPIFLEHAHRTCILAERWLGCAQNSNNCAYIMVGNGIGASIYADGRPLGGRDQMAGELGHIVIDPHAPDRCNCGKFGCLEAIASSPNIWRQYAEKTGRPVRHMLGSKVVEVFERARQKDPVALAVLNRAAEALGSALASLTNLMNPELIILGGDLVGGADVLLHRIVEHLNRRAIPDFLEGLQVRVSSLGPDIGLMGAASLAFRSSLLDPKLLRKICCPVSESLHPIARSHAAHRNGRSRAKMARV